MWADFEHDDQMEVLTKECHALSDGVDDLEDRDSSEESIEEDSDESAETEVEDYETDFIPGQVRIMTEKEKEVEDNEDGDMLGEDVLDYPLDGGLIGGDDHDYLPHNDGPINGMDHNDRLGNNLPVSSDYPERYGDFPSHAEDDYMDYEEDSNDFGEEEEEMEEPMVPTDKHIIKKKILPAEQARLGLVNRAMKKLLSDESTSLTCIPIIRYELCE